MPLLPDPLLERLKRLVPREYAERLLSTRGQLEGERRLVTILFSDVKGSTAMAEHLDPEDVMEIMNGAFEVLIPPIYKYEGTLARLMGDAILAFFGAPLGHEDDPERAVRAGLEIIAGAQDYAARLEEERGIAGFNVRVGINTGLVVLGEIGSDLRVEYTAMGDAINLAARMEQNAPPGGILITEDTFRHVQGLFDVEELAPIPVKGHAEPVGAHLVLRARPRAFRVQRHGVAGIQTRMIGRGAELKQLQDALYQALEESERQVVTVLGEAGVGKSRLLDEFDAWLRDLPETVYYFKGRASAELQAVPYALLRDMVNLRFNIVESDPPQVAREKVEQGFASPQGTAPKALSPAQAHILGYLLGFDFGDSPHVQALGDDAQQLRDRGLVYLTEYFRAVAGDHPVVVLLEDLHWADDSSLDAINRLSLALPDVPLLIVGPARPNLLERRPHWGEGQLFHSRIELKPLSRRDCRHLVEEILQKVDRVPGELRETVIGGAEGNPLYVEELIKTLIEEGVIVTGEERWRIDLSRLAQVEVPPTLTAVLQARLDHLPPEERTILQWAAVVGRTFWDRAVAHIAASSEVAAAGEVAALLAVLRGRELVYQRETSVFAEAQEYMFKHAALREVAYEGILKKVCRVYHTLAAEWLIAQGEGESLGLIAGHLEQAGDVERAFSYLKRAGESEARRYANAEAIGYYSRALALLPAGDPARCDLLWAREALYDLRGEREQQAHDLEEMESLVGQLGDRHLQARVQMRRGNYYVAVSDLPAALAACQAAIELVGQVPGQSEEVLELEANTLRLWGTVLMRRGKYDPACEKLEQARALAQTAGLSEIEILCLSRLAEIHQVRGEHAQTRAYLDQALQLSRQTGSKRSEKDALNMLGIMADIQGDYAAARAYFEQALQISREIGDRCGELVGLANLGYGAQLLGDYDRAGSCYDQTRSIGEELSERNAGIVALLNLSLVSHQQGQHRKASDYARQALAESREAGFRSHEAFAWTNLGHALLALALPDEADEAYRTALQIRRDLGEMPLVTEDWAGLARVALAQGDLEQACAHVAEIESYLAGGSNLDGAEEPFWVYLTCYQVLRAAAEPRAEEVLTAAHALLEERAARIPDPALRGSFLENVPWHREIAQQYQRSRGKRGEEKLER